MKWYRIENKGPERAEIWIYEQIGEDFWSGEGVTAKNFQKEISAITAKNIDLHINSPGGAVFDGVAIYNLLKQHQANITTYIDGLAASIASVIALAGDKVVMAENALYMMHNPFGVVMGNASDMRSMADVLDKIRGTMTGVYAGKSGKDNDEINALLDAETWFTADEALEAGFIDEIGVEMDLAASASFVPAMSKAGFKKIPKEIAAKKELNERDIEKALREAGCSRGQAKGILAKGIDGLNVREAQTDPPTPPQREAEPVNKDRIADLLDFGLKFIQPA
jgi:ATP-dependent Clp endopeptidase proteolytic subunit ClpP